MLPLPMATLVSLTITFKLDKSPRVHQCCCWTSLRELCLKWPLACYAYYWQSLAQKVRRWHDFIIVSCTHSVFRHNKEYVAQLLRSCFTTFLGSLHVFTPSLLSESGVSGLLGSTISDRSVRPFLAPGFFYLRSCQSMQNVLYINEVIVGLVAEYARNSALRWATMESPRLKSSQASLCLATARAREVATLGACLLCIAGGFWMVQELYMESIPSWLLSTKEMKQENVSAISRVVEGYAMAYLFIISGCIMWSVHDKLPKWVLTKRVRIVGVHMDFLAGVLEGKIATGLSSSHLKAYVSCLVGLMVNFAPAWIQEVKLKTLRTLASGLRGWHECELALSLLERGGVAAIGPAAELVNVIS